MKLLEKQTIHATREQAAQQVLDVVPLVMRTLRAQMREHRGENLSVPQFRTLGFLKRREGASLSEVAEHIGLTLPSMSKLVDGLVARKLVVRETYAGDRRRVTLALSARGRATHEAAVGSTRAFLVERLACLDEAERVDVARAMQILRPLFAGERERSADREIDRHGDS